MSKRAAPKSASIAKSASIEEDSIEDAITSAVNDHGSELDD